jgi:rhodanese-related sulfurtransferase
MTATEFFEAKVANTISPMDFMAARGQSPDGYAVVDVRNAPPHMKKAKIAGATEIPLAEMEARFGELPKERTIVLYCWESWCNMAARAALILLKEGYTVRELSGGIAAWQSLDLPTEAL